MNGITGCGGNMSGDALMIKEALIRRYYQWKVSRLPHEWATSCYCGGLFDKDLRHGYTFMVCKECGVVTTARRLTADSVDRLYREGLYRKAMTGRSGVDLEHVAKERRRFGDLTRWACRTLRIYMTEKFVADMGCGLGGGLLEAFQQGVRHAWGYEIDPTTVRVARDVFGFHVADTEDGWDVAEMVVASHVLEHLYNPLTFLRQVAERCMGRDSTILVIEVPEFTQDTVPSPWHLWHFNKESLRRLVSLAGLRVDVIEPGIRAIVRRG